MTTTERILPATPVGSLDGYLAAGGGRGRAAAMEVDPDVIIDTVERSGLRGRGGAGFPTGTKWRTVASYAASTPALVVVNGAEGEPGTFKDRALMRANPYAIVEGALIAAHAVRADRVVIAIKDTFDVERRALERALREAEAAGWCNGVEVGLATGPGEYLFGEETALMEVLDGRPPFPRIAPPFRHGADEVGGRPDEPAGARLSQPGPDGAPPTLANNVETMCNVAAIVAEGPEWFRSVGTQDSPGTIVCTISGATQRAGVAELAMGTTLGEAIEIAGGGARRARRLVAAMSGVANPLVPADLFDTPLTYEDMQRIGSGLGAAGFIVFDDGTDLAAVAAGVSRFLAVESCGQCTPCKHDGLEIAAKLERVAGGDGNEYDVAGIADRVATVADEARCFLAHQHQRVIDSVLQLFPAYLRAHLDGALNPATPEPIAPIKDIVDGRVELDVDQLRKQPDWTFDDTDSGQFPAERLATRTARR